MDRSEGGSPGPAVKGAYSLDTASSRPHPLFARVPEPLWTQTLDCADRLSVPKGNVVYDRTRFRRCLGIVLRGRIQVRRETLLVSTLQAGDLFGAAALFNKRASYPTTLTALSDCEALLIPQEEIRRLLRVCGPFAEDYVTYLSGRIQFLSARLGVVSAGSNRDKLARYLLDAPDGEVTLSAAQLCQRLGVGRASLYRAFEALEQAGAIAREGKTIRILNRDRLNACRQYQNQREED